MMGTNQLRLTATHTRVPVLTHNESRLPRNEVFTLGITSYSNQVAFEGSGGLRGTTGQTQSLAVPKCVADGGHSHKSSYRSRFAID